MILSKQRLLAVLAVILSCSFIHTVNAKIPQNFSQAKKIAHLLFANHRHTLYCGCMYNKYKQVNLHSCGMQSASNKKRAHRIEWEHMMPAENFGRQLPCWRKPPICIKKNGKRLKNRKCCRKISKTFRAMEGELYNLWPAVGLVNQARSNYRYAQIYNSLAIPKIYYGCPIIISKHKRKVEPFNTAKGIVARANLFMAAHYGIKLSSSQRRLFKAWNKTFPPTTWEKQWAARIARIEGYPNPYITRKSARYDI